MGEDENIIVECGDIADALEVCALHLEDFKRAAIKVVTGWDWEPQFVEGTNDWTPESIRLKDDLEEGVASLRASLHPEKDLGMIMCPTCYGHGIDGSDPDAGVACSRCGGGGRVYPWQVSEEAGAAWYAERVTRYKSP